MKPKAEKYVIEKLILESWNKYHYGPEITEDKDAKLTAFLETHIMWKRSKS